MFFQSNKQQNDQTADNVSIRQKRQQFHKQIRKQALNNKLREMRCRLFSKNMREQKYYYDQSLLNDLPLLNIQCYKKLIQKGEKQQDNNITVMAQYFSLLSKFNKLQFNSSSSLKIKKNSKKIDGVIELLMMLQVQILQNSVKQLIMEELKHSQEINIQQQNENNKKQLLIDEQTLNLKGLKPMQCTQPEIKTNLELLKQIIQSILIEKVNQFIQFIDQEFYQKNIQCPLQYISPKLLKYTFFYVQNIQKHYTYYGSGYSCWQWQITTQNEQSQKWLKQSKHEQLNQILIMISRNLRPGLLCQIIFKNMSLIQYFRKDNQKMLQILNVSNFYISSSPYQYFMSGSDKGNYFLNQLVTILGEKIDEGQKELIKLQLQSFYLQSQTQISQLKWIQNQQYELNTSKMYLQQLTDILQKQEKEKSKKQQKQLLKTFQKLKISQIQ